MLTADSILNNLPGDKAAIRRYVTSAASTSLADGSVAVNVTHSNLRQLVQELRFDLHTTIADVKRRLYTFNGSSQDAMELHLKDASGNLLARMLDESRPLGYYGCASGMTIHCVDNDPFSLSRNGGLDDVSRIEKYRMSDEDYDQREKSYRNFKREKLAADPTWRPPHLAGKETSEDFVDPACVSAFSVGQRCAVAPGERRGEIKFVGAVEGLGAGFWVGVQLDEPLGRNDGSYKGVRYFDAPNTFGSFVRPSLVTIGDFKPLWEDELNADVGGAEAHDHDHAGGACCAAPAAPAPPVAAAPAAAKERKPKRRDEIDDDDEI